MECPNCNFTIDDNSKKCINCEYNVQLFKKCINISYKFYNKGLYFVKNKYFFDAIASLEKALYFNKKNIEARNLLGLLHYKVGHLADAVKHWIISSNFDKKEDNIAFEYIDIFRKNIRKFEKYNDSVRLYNQAIKYLKKRDDDMAIIRLKKALSINPDFIAAMNLLTFCYILQGKIKKTLDLTKDVLKLDINNKIALTYLNEVNKNAKNNNKILEEEYEFNGKIEIIENKKNSNGFNFIFIFFLGFIFSALLMYFMFIPAYKSKAQVDLQKYTQKNQEFQQAFEDLKLETEKEKAILTEEKEKLEAEIAAYKKASYLRENIDKIDEALNLFKKRDFEQAKSIIDSIDTNGFNSEILEKYNEVKNKINNKIKK